MYIVTQKTASVVWDGIAKRPLAQFVNGVFETGDKAVADALKAAGYDVMTDAPKVRQTKNKEE